MNFGKDRVFISLQLLNMIENGSTVAASHIFNILVDILSWSLSIIDLIILIISLFSNFIEESLVFVV